MLELDQSTVLQSVAEHIRQSQILPDEFRSRRKSQLIAQREAFVASLLLNHLDSLPQDQRRSTFLHPKTEKGNDTAADGSTVVDPDPGTSVCDSLRTPGEGDLLTIQHWTH